MKIRQLARHEIDDLWSIDRSETIEKIYVHDRGRLVLGAERHEVEDWPVGEPELYQPKLLACLDRGGRAFGAFEGDTLVGGAVLDARFLGRPPDQLQLAFLHVSRRFRNLEIGRQLFETAASAARELGARRLYISATPSENTVRFYLRRGCRPAKVVDPELFALEPEDIHMELDLEPMRRGEA